jgi:hypothetical protein
MLPKVEILLTAIFQLNPPRYFCNLLDLIHRFGTEFDRPVFRNTGEQHIAIRRKVNGAGQLVQPAK